MSSFFGTYRPNPRPSARPICPRSRYRYVKLRWRFLAACIDVAGAVLCGIVSRFQKLMRARVPSKHARTDAAPRSILVVQLDHLGDAVLTTPMIRALRSLFPTAAIDVLASSANAAVFRDNPHVREVLVSLRNWHERTPARKSTIAEIARLARQLRSRRYDLGIDPRGDIFVILTLWLAGIPRRLGWACGGAGFLLTDTATWDARQHELAARSRLIEQLRHPGQDSMNESVDTEIAVGWGERYVIREMMEALPEAAGPTVVVHTGAGTAAKQWPASHFSDLANRIHRELNGRVILVGSATDAAKSRHIARATATVFDWTARLSLHEFAALCQLADAFVGADSGPAHVAAAMRTPTIVLFSGTNRSECWRPIGPYVHVLRQSVACSPCHLTSCPVSNHPCMTEIQPGHVLQAVRQAVQETIRTDRSSNLLQPFAFEAA